MSVIGMERYGTVTNRYRIVLFGALARVTMSARVRDWRPRVVETVSIVCAAGSCN